jgi:transcriptional regulator with GAF, ATPase, and Fis domain
MNGEAKQFSNDAFVRRYHALLQVSEAIVAHKDLASLFQDLAERLPLITPYDFLGILLYDGERRVIRLHSLTTPSPLSVTVHQEVSVDTSPSGFVWRTQEPLFIDVEQETRFPYMIDLLRSQGSGQPSIRALPCSITRAWKMPGLSSQACWGFC